MPAIQRPTDPEDEQGKLGGELADPDFATVRRWLNIARSVVRKDKAIRESASGVAEGDNSPLSDHS